MFSPFSAILAASDKPDLDDFTQHQIDGFTRMSDISYPNLIMKFLGISLIRLVSSGFRRHISIWCDWA